MKKKTPTTTKKGSNIYVFIALIKKNASVLYVNRRMNNIFGVRLPAYYYIVKIFQS